MSDKPMGYRDVYWCWIVNEPMIITYKNDIPQCSICNWLCESTQIDANFLSQHTFIQHIKKPQT